MATKKSRKVRASLADQRTYWQKRLAGELPILNLPTDYPRPPAQSFIRASKELEIDETSYSELKKYCSRDGITLFTTLLAAFKILLLRYTQQEDIIVGSVCPDSISKRGKKGPEECANLIGLRTNLDGNASAKEVLQRVARTVEEAAENRDYPFERLIDDLESVEHLNRASIFQAMLILLNVPNCISETPISEGDLEGVQEEISRIIRIAVVEDHQIVRQILRCVWIDLDRTVHSVPPEDVVGDLDML